MLIGDKRKFNSVLVTLRCDPDGEGGFKPTLTGLAKEVDPDCATVADAQQSALWQDYITEAISVRILRLLTHHFILGRKGWERGGGKRRRKEWGGEKMRGEESES